MNEGKFIGSVVLSQSLTDSHSSPTNEQTCQLSPIWSVTQAIAPSRIRLQFRVRNCPNLSPHQPALYMLSMIERNI